MTCSVNARRAAAGSARSGAGATGGTTALRFDDEMEAGEASARCCFLLASLRMASTFGGSVSHLEVLRLHQRAHEVGDGWITHVIGVRALVALDDAPAVREEVRDDVRLIEPRVFGLHVEDVVLPLDVVVEAHLRAPKARALHLGLELFELGWRIVRDGRFELPVVARDALHALERHLRETRRWIDAQRFGHQLLAGLIVFAVRGPGAKQRHGLVGSAFLHEPLRQAKC
jgi:hypothetical protein